MKMRKIAPIAALAILIACNNSKKNNEPGKESSEITNIPAENSATPTATSAIVAYSIGDTLRKVGGSVLLQKDKEKLSPGNDNLAVVTANGSDGESIVVNFLFALKPGIYPVVGLSFSRENQVFGGLLGGTPKLTNYKVTLTQCEDLGSNNFGGHKWKISGSVDGEVTIEAMGIMKIDKNHPSEIKVNKISFSNLTFDDNWEEMMKQAIDKMKEKKN